MFSPALLVATSGESIRTVVSRDSSLALLWLLHASGSWVALDYGSVNVGLHWFLSVDFGFRTMIVTGGCFSIIEKELGQWSLWCLHCVASFLQVL